MEHHLASVSTRCCSIRRVESPDRCTATSRARSDVTSEQPTTASQEYQLGPNFTAGDIYSAPEPVGNDGGGGDKSTG